MSQTVKILLTKLSLLTVVVGVFILTILQFGIDKKELSQDHFNNQTVHFSQSNHSHSHTNIEWIDSEKEEETETEKAAKKAMNYVFIVCIYAC